MVLGPSLAFALWALGAAPERLPMPEPLLGETLTDLNSDEAGELELEGTGVVLLPGEGDSPEWAGALEAEWRVTERLGLGLARPPPAGGARRARPPPGRGVGRARSR